MTHYFENDGKALTTHKFEQRICGQNFCITSGDGVFSKNEVDEGTLLLIEAAMGKLSASDKIADLGCGYGVVGVALLAMLPNAYVSFYDINEKAIELSKINAAAYSKRAQFFCGDGIGKRNEFDAVVVNPPFRAGNNVLFKLFDDAFASLKNGGRLFVVLRKKQGAQTYAKKLGQVFGQNGEILSKKKGYIVYEFCKK